MTRRLTNHEVRTLRQFATRGLIVDGAHMAEVLGGADSVARADKLLSYAESRQWLERGKHLPTAALRFFGVGGSMQCLGSHPVEYVWGVRFNPWASWYRQRSGGVLFVRTSYRL